MTKELSIKLEDGTFKDIKFTAHAATKIFYRNMFHKDIEIDINKLLNGEDLSDDADMSFADKLAFIMNMSAEGKKISTLSEDDYIEWLTQFDAYAFIDEFIHLFEIYRGQQISEATPKK